MSGSAPARAHFDPDAGNPDKDAAEGLRPSANLERSGVVAPVSPYIVPGVDAGAAPAITSGAPRSFKLSDLNAPTYVLVALLATFVVIAPYFMHANWGALGPIWARIASAVVLGSHPVGDHVLTPNVDVVITWQCSGAENM